MSWNSHRDVGDRVEKRFISISFQHGPVGKRGQNGCRVEEVIEVIVDKLRDYQRGQLACVENDEAMDHMELAKLALLRRRKLRQDQGVFDTLAPHHSLHETRTEDDEEDFSATGA
jgi:hypothetical protein